jgi:hypothetical protein
VRIAGVSLAVHPMTAVFVAAVAWSGYASISDAKVTVMRPWWRDPGTSLTTTPPGMGWAIAAAAGAALVVLGSILLSGLGHIAALRRVGLRPTGIQLLFFCAAVTFAEDGRSLPARSWVLLEGSGLLVTAVLAFAAYGAVGDPFGATAAHSVAELFGIVLLRTCLLFNALALVLGLLGLLAARAVLARG